MVQKSTFALFIITTLSMVAFAMNSIFCRIALSDTENSPWSFAAVRILAGAIALFFLNYKANFKSLISAKVSWAGLSLFVYALLFSLAYVDIDAGAGALILFMAVQVTMISQSLISGDRLSLTEWLGIALALSGLVYLLLPGATSPPLGASVLMMISGVAWGAYSILGKNSVNPIETTFANFAIVVPMSICILLYLGVHLNTSGWIGATASGAVTSGLGYGLWYYNLRFLQTSTAAVVQLSVPALAGLGGVLFLAEAMSLKFIIASLLILSGIFTKIKFASTSASNA